MSTILPPAYLQKSHDFDVSVSTINCGSLPYPPLTNFIGREQEVTNVKKLLATHRLLTLVGTAGCGKTRLAFHVSTELQGTFEHDIKWIGLASLTDPLLLPGIVAHALDLGEQQTLSWIGHLSEYLHSRKLLLVLDNCEHVIAACAQLTEVLLRACPNLKILATSRELLDISGETSYLVPPLSLPDPRYISSPEELKQFGSTLLFVERARAALPSFVLTQENMQAVMEICQRLDGIPLAIEFAAAQVKGLSVKQIALRLDDCCNLTGGHRTVLPQHQTLRASFDWGYNLLSEQEQTLFRRLSIFREPFTLEDAETICAGEGIEHSEILALLLRLVAKSLVQAENWHTETHYRLLETARQYGQDKLQKIEGTATPTRHSNWYLNWTEQTKLESQHLSPFSKNSFSSQKSVPSELHIFALGTTRIDYSKPLSSLPVNWRYAKSRELLFYLLCFTSRTKGQIGLALWPDVSPAQLRRNFHATLHDLRRVLGQPEWIIFENNLYTFNRKLAYWFDVEAFESHVTLAHELRSQAPERAIHFLKEGIKLYQGDFLDDILRADWSQSHREKLRTLYLDAMLALGQLFFTLHQFTQAAEIYRQLIAYDNFLETAHRELIRCYAYQGNHGQALRHYQDVVTLLHNAFGSPPATETVRVFERLQRGEAP